MSYQSHLQHAKKCLAAGRLSEMRTWIRRAESLAASEGEAHEVCFLALRCCLLTGHYEQGETIRRDMERRWPDSPSTIAMREALFAAAGWGPTLLDTVQPDVFTLVRSLVCDSFLSPEAEMKTLGDWSRHLPRHPAWIKELAANPFPEDTIAKIGERVLPPNAEAVFAELWHLQDGLGEYPRRPILEEHASELGFEFLPAYLDMLASLQQENIPAALAACDRLFVADGTWLWLRALDLVRHFGTPEILERTPLRLRIARRTIGSLGTSSGDTIFLQEYQPLMSSFTCTVSRCLPPSPKTSASHKKEWGEENPTLGEAVMAAETLLSLSCSSSIAPWSASPGACLLVERLLLALRGKDLPAKAAFSDLQALHLFVKTAEDCAPDTASLWLALPSRWHSEETYWPLLLGAMPAAPEKTAFACAAILHKYGASTTVVWEGLPSSGQAAVFAAKPEPFKLTAMKSVPVHVLCHHWAGLVGAVVTLGGKKLNNADRSSLEPVMHFS